ncbi:hypothetical protein CICLE_v10010661mg [Citrus x clementina]|uniref:Nudix hydrolase domain-containing protein n=1 Tax=Citrus clementina TaxID=85681 RepID=V4UET7_CITCL|nr:hypothetical protein CICLE_v10010661mg [Citrus x clementina]
MMAAALLNGSRCSSGFRCQNFAKEPTTSLPKTRPFPMLLKAFSSKGSSTSTSAKLKSSLMPSLLGGGSVIKKKEINVLSPDITAPIFAPEFLDAFDDEYDGVIINPENLPSSANAFVSALRASLSNWKLKGKKGVWLKILSKQADLVPIAIQEGFSYHHAEPGYVMLTYWIPVEPCMLPGSPSHQIGVGGFVMNDKREVLVVKEECPRSCSGVWKIPTGYINKSEDLFSGAVREVKEETGWMPLEEFVKQPFYLEDDMSRKVIDICIKAYDDRFNGFIAHELASKLDGKLSCLYHNDC